MVHGLIPGETYVFRVQAVNVFGLSEESQESSPITVEPALCKNCTVFGTYEKSGLMVFRTVMLKSLNVSVDTEMTKLLLSFMISVAHFITLCRRGGGVWYVWHS